jgi:hypothetical protein
VRQAIVKAGGKPELSQHWQAAEQDGRPFLEAWDAACQAAHQAWLDVRKGRRREVA